MKIFTTKRTKGTKNQTSFGSDFVFFVRFVVNS